MAKIRFLVALSALLLFLHACNNSEGNQEETVFKRAPEIAEIKPQRPVKIKLKRNAKGNYSWELSGDDAKKIIEADKKLRGSIEKRD
ncbi:MAG TPA: hypothetical protein ENH01_12360 [Nitrospirae bacterium]|nr:hypothetical protein [Nitrospirota bacterium]